MFIPNYNKTAIINTAHIISVGISVPYLEQKNHRVVANLTYGTAVLYDGNKESCEDFLATLYRTID